MSKRSITALVASHILVIWAGVLLARQSAKNEDHAVARHESTTSAPGKSALPGRESPWVASSVHPPGEWQGSEFARAWNAVQTGKFTTRERIKVQRDLLKKWAEVDLAAAIHAALGEAWDTDGGGYYDQTGFLLDVFWDAFAKNPQVGWDMIRDKQFGVATGMLRHIWINAVGRKDPLFLATRIGDLSWRDRQSALSACRDGVSNRTGGVTNASLLKVFAGFPEDVVTAEQLAGFATSPGGPKDADSLKKEILGMGSGDERMAKVTAILLGRALASKSAEEVAGEIQDLPKGIREEVLWSAFTNRMPPDAKMVSGFLDSLIQENAWSKLEQADTVRRIQWASRNGGAEDVAGWATSLPVRKETLELFHRSVETYLCNNMETARAWIADIPTDEWRNRAYAEYSQQALYAHNDPEASRWALDQIGDNNFKAEAESWRFQWEKRTGWKAK
jgi:hypothetical protein